MEQQANNIATTTNHLNGNPSTHKSPHTASMAPSSINNMRTVGTAVAASASAATMLPRLQHQPHCHHLHWRCCHRRRRRRRRQMRFPATESVSRTRSQPKTTCTNILLTCGHQNATKTPTTTTTTRATRSCGQRRHELIAMVIIMMLGAVNVCRAKADQPDIQQPVAKRLISGAAGDQNDWDSVERSLQIIHDISTENLGSLCVTKSFRTLSVALNTQRYDGTRQKVDMAATVLQEMGLSRHGALLDALAKSLLLDEHVSCARILATNTSNGVLSTLVWWAKPQPGHGDGPRRVQDDGVQVGAKPSISYPWYDDDFATPSAHRSQKFVTSAEHIAFGGFWTFPYFSCAQRRWIVSYGVVIPPATRHDLRGYLSIDIDVSQLHVNQCNRPDAAFVAMPSSHQRSAAEQSTTSLPPPSASTSASSSSSMMIIAQFQSMRTAAISPTSADTDATSGARHDGSTLAKPTATAKTARADAARTFNQVDAFHGSHKCHEHSMECDFRPPTPSSPASVSTQSPIAPVAPQTATTAAAATGLAHWTRGAYQCSCRRGFYSLRHPAGFAGALMEVAFQEWRDNVSAYYATSFQCLRCAPGCDTCSDASPCLATYNWPFRLTLLTISVLCVGLTLALCLYVYRSRKVKVFQVASPPFLTITLIGCAIMYLEMAAIFPILDVCSCIATKWTRHMGFCLTYTALLMKTWRVSLTYRVKSAHKMKLTDKQLLQWMVPILLVMLIYLGTWTLSGTPFAEVIRDNHGLKFMLCSYNWWDHSLAIGEVLFLAWGIRVCYNVRNAESLYNEARMISYAIYNIALVNIAMIAFHVCILPNAGPDIKYLLGFIRTQLSTSVTIALVFGPKMALVLRGDPNKLDKKLRITSNIEGVGCGGASQPIDPIAENDDLKKEVQKLAAQIEFMKIVHMEIGNRHVKPKPGGYFTMVSVFQSPQSRAAKVQDAVAHTQSGGGGGGSNSRPSTHQNSAAISEDGHSGASSIGCPSSSLMLVPLNPPPPTIASSAPPSVTIAETCFQSDGGHLP